MVSGELIPGYWLKVGSGLDRAKLLKFLHRTYQEVYPAQEGGHLAKTVEQYFSNQTPLWWVEVAQETGEEGEKGTFYASVSPATVGCLWLGNAIDQVLGTRHANIFMLYVVPAHRRQGIGSALLKRAEEWARARGDRQIGLQVFVSNEPAIHLYQKLGYQTHSLSMIKSL